MIPVNAMGALIVVVLAMVGCIVHVRPSAHVDTPCTVHLVDEGDKTRLGLPTQDGSDLSGTTLAAQFSVDSPAVE